MTSEGTSSERTRNVSIRIPADIVNASSRIGRIGTIAISAKLAASVKPATAIVPDAAEVRAPRGAPGVLGRPLQVLADEREIAKSVELVGGGVERAPGDDRGRTQLAEPEHLVVDHVPDDQPESDPDGNDRVEEELRSAVEFGHGGRVPTAVARYSSGIASARPDSSV